MDKELKILGQDFPVDILSISVSDFFFTHNTMLVKKDLLGRLIP